MKAFIGSLVCIATVLTVVLKLTGVTPDISWWWVLSPLWGSTVAYYAFYIIVGICGCGCAIVNRRRGS